MNQQLVLIGGGHAHAIALKEWGANPLPKVDLTLISDVGQTPYSGMLPGHVAGFYSYEETHINLASLAEYAGAKLIIDRAVSLDLGNNRVICQQQQIAFDYLSLDIGSTPQTANVPGAQAHAIPAKPVPEFLAAWELLQQNAAAHAANDQSLSIAIVGGGAGGVELALNMQTCLKNILGDDAGANSANRQQLQIHLIHRGDKLLAGHNDWVSQKLEEILRQREIKLHLNQSVSAVFPERVECKSGLKIDCNYTFWVTQATAPKWLTDSGLDTDSQGFVLVKDTLLSCSHPHIFAAGDIATMINYQRPKAGVFAVRQGKPLLTNWQNILTDRPLIAYTPQEKYLGLIGTADGKAIASRGNLGWRSPLLWWLKDYIDRQFMNQFKGLSNRDLN